jgi:chloramphenicol-sensitive protein RarD
VASTQTETQTNQRLGVLAALGAFIFWGLAPIYFKWLGEVSAVEIIIHRVIWAIPLLVAVLFLRDGPGFWRRMLLPRKTILTLWLSGTLVAINWLIFVWAVNHDHVLETSLGYFINPLVNVLLGFVFLKERLTKLQTVAVVIAAVGTAFLAWFLGAPPWISLALGFSFGFYGLVRKQLGVGPMIGLLWETILLSVPALFAGIWIAQTSGFSWGNISTEVNWLLVGTGAVTVIPLVWFNTAAQNLSLSVVGFFQYIAPTLTFFLAVFFYGEAFTLGHKVAFACIWFSLALVSAEGLFRPRRVRIP